MKIFGQRGSKPTAQVLDKNIVFELPAVRFAKIPFEDEPAEFFDWLGGSFIESAQRIALESSPRLGSSPHSHRYTSIVFSFSFGPSSGKTGTIRSLPAPEARVKASASTK